MGIKLHSKSRLRRNIGLAVKLTSNSRMNRTIAIMEIRNNTEDVISQQIGMLLKLKDY